MVKRAQTRRAKSKKIDMTCKQVTSLIMDYLNGELDPETTLAFEKHLNGCSDCVAFLNTYEKTTEATRSLRHEDIPAEVEKRVRQFLQEQIKGLRRGR
jgi:anti-sigma factor RsiW